LQYANFIIISNLFLISNLFNDKISASILESWNCKIYYIIIKSVHTTYFWFTLVDVAWTYIKWQCHLSAGKWMQIAALNKGRWASHEKCHDSRSQAALRLYGYFFSRSITERGKVNYAIASLIQRRMIDDGWKSNLSLSTSKLPKKADPHFNLLLVNNMCQSFSSTYATLSFVLLSIQYTYKLQ